MLDLSSRKVYGALAEQCVGGDAKADKVENATSGHLAGLDSNGNLTDSGVSPTEEVTIEGNPVTFESPFEQDAKSVVVSVKPIQDLHGLPFPYVGGAYKNKLPLTLAKLKSDNSLGTWSGNAYTVRGITYTVLTDNNDNVIGIDVDGTSTADFAQLRLSAIPVAQGSYIINGITNGSTDGLRFDVDGIGSYKTITNGDVAVDASVDSTCIFDVVVRRSGTVVNHHKVYPMLRLATESDATFAPYSNICPISGSDRISVINFDNSNLFDESSAQNGYFDNFGNLISNSGWKSDYIDVTEGTNYRISGCNEIIGGAYFIWFDSNKNKISIVSEHKNGIYLAPTNAFYLGISEATGNENISVTTGHTTTIPLPSTLYGGTVDVTNGSADDNKGLVEFDGTDNTGWEFRGAYGTSVRFDYSGLSLEPVIGSEDSISNYLTLGIIGTNDLECFNFHAINKNLQVQIHADRLASSDVSGLMGFFASNPLQINYELATPITIQLTPTDVELLEGTNIVSTNGEKVAVTYGRSLWQDIDDLKTDTEGKLDKSDVADVEGDTASRAYSVNEFMLRSDGLYKVTQPIAQNASITASNTTKTTIGAVLTALLNA